MSIAQNFPNLKPSLLLDFSNTKELDSRVTFTRASTATYYGTQTAKAEENLLIYSQEFDNAAWSKSGTVATANTGDTNAPDSTSTAEKITASAGTAVHVCDITTSGQAATINGEQYAYSVFAKKGTLNFIQLYVTADGTTHANFDLDTGVVGTTGGTVTTAITNVGNGWYRCSIIFTTGGTDRRIGIALVNSSSATRRLSWNAAGTEDVYLWGAQAEQRSAVTAYTPTTDQPITNYIPVLETAASGVARFDHNPTTFESLGLLIEESRANLILQSEDLDTTWAETRATLALNSVIAPSGALTADGLIASTDNDTHFTSQTFTGTAAAHTFSVYAKASGLNHVALRLFNGTSQVGLAYYNLSTGATGTVTAGTAAITSVGNGWYRCALTATLAASASCTADIQLANADNTNSFAGNAFSGVTLWGAQVELGAFATSYIPTVASQVTRAADAASMTGTNFSSWYTGGAGTVYSESAVYATNIKTQGVWDLPKGATETSLRSPHSTDPRLRALIGGIFSTLGAGPAITSNVPIKATVAWQGLSGRLQSGSTAVNVTATANLDATQLLIGSLGSAGANSLNGTLKKLAFYPARLTDTQLQALTS